MDSSDSMTSSTNKVLPKFLFLNGISTLRSLALLFTFGCILSVMTNYYLIIEACLSAAIFLHYYFLVLPASTRARHLENYYEFLGVLEKMWDIFWSYVVKSYPALGEKVGRVQDKMSQLGRTHGQKVVDVKDVVTKFTALTVESGKTAYQMSKGPAQKLSVAVVQVKEAVSNVIQVLLGMWREWSSKTEDVTLIEPKVPEVKAEEPKVTVTKEEPVVSVVETPKIEETKVSQMISAIESQLTNTKEAKVPEVVEAPVTKTPKTDNSRLQYYPPRISRIPRKVESYVGPKPEKVAPVPKKVESVVEPKPEKPQVAEIPEKVEPVVESKPEHSQVALVTKNVESVVESEPENPRLVRIPVEFEFEVELETEAEIEAVFEPFEPRTDDVQLVIPVVIVTPPETEEVVPAKVETVEERVTPEVSPKVVELTPVQEVQRAPLETKAPVIVPPKPVFYQAKPQFESFADVPAVPEVSAAPVPQVPVIPPRPVIDQPELAVRDPVAPPMGLKFSEPRFPSDYKFLDYSKEGSIEEKNFNRPSSDGKLVEKKTVTSGKKTLKYIHFSNKIEA